MTPAVTVALVQIVSVTVIGVFPARIARQQREISQQQLEINTYRVKLDLYDRRWKVCERFAQYVDTASSDLNPTTQDTLEFARATRQTEFLFSADIKEYRSALIRHGADLHKWHDMYRDYGQETPPGYDHDKVVKGHAEESEWFAAQPDAMAKRFEPYLNLSRLGLREIVWVGEAAR